MAFEAVTNFDNTLTRIAPYMSKTVSKGRDAFGEPWEEKFNEMLVNIFGQDEERLEKAIRGYVRFALDATKLQKRFEKEREYINKTYEEAANAVYHNEEYMNGLYMPGILLSQYLWPHHYRQLTYFHEQFVPKVLANDDKRFCDVGIGTGFYSRQLLSASKEISGNGFDISQFAKSFATMQIESFGFKGRWDCTLRNVIDDCPEEQWPFLLSVEVLEHLEDPVAFLKSLRRMLKQGGTAFITAALTAPNEDHIYLYNTCEEIVDQMKEAGFSVVDYQEEIAFEPKKDEPVPRVASFIVE